MESISIRARKCPFSKYISREVKQKEDESNTKKDKTFYTDTYTDS